MLCSTRADIDSVISTLVASREAQLYLFPAWAVLSGLGGFALCHLGLKLLRKRRCLLRLRAPEIRGAAAGVVELHGLAQGESTISSAITAQPCYYYRAVAWQESADRTWQKVAEETELIPFCLDNTTGRVQVNPHGAEMDLLRDFHEEYGKATLQTQTDLPQSVTAFLARHNVSTAKGVCVEEYRISPRSPLFVVGTLAEKEESQLAALNFPLAPFPPKKSAASERGETPALAAAEGTHHEVVRLSPRGTVGSATAMSMQSRVAAALSRAGVQNPVNWETAAPATSAVPRPQSKPEQAELAPLRAIGKGQTDSTFVISWRSRRESANAPVWPAAMLVLGSVLLLASSYCLLTSLGWR